MDNIRLPERKPTRLKDYDYSSGGSYFITICSKDKKPIFSRIVGDGFLDVPQVVLTEYGTIINRQINIMGEYYKNIKINNYVIMPNHIHILISVYRDGSSGMPTPTNKAIPSFVGTLKRFVNRNVGKNIFQRSFNDHIIRDECDYLARWQYIENNPLKWKLDELYS